MANPVTLLLGAGASFPYGIPMMAGFYREFRDYVKRRHPHCFLLLKGLEDRGGHAQPDLETLLSDLQAVLGVAKGLAMLGEVNGSMDVRMETARELRGYLEAYIVDRCERFDDARAGREMAAVLALRRFGPLWIFTTNYDRVVETACDRNSIGWSDGFQQGAPTPVADWLDAFDSDVRVVKLHGSVNWYEDDPGGALHRLDRGYSLPAYDFRLNRGSQRLRPLMIIPTLEKQALNEPYVGLSMRFTDVLRESRILIIAGNSLRDGHLRGYIKQRLSGLHVLIVSPNAVATAAALGESDRICALNAGFSEFLTLGATALMEMVDQAMAVTDDGAIGETIRRFVATAARDIEDDAAVREDPQFKPIWTDLTSASVPIRVAATKALATHPHPAVVRKVTQILQTDSSASVRVAAIDSLMRLLSVEAAEEVSAALLRDGAMDVQMEAALALIRLGESGRPWLVIARAREGLLPTVRALIDRTMESPIPALMP